MISYLTAYLIIGLITFSFMLAQRAIISPCTNGRVGWAIFLTGLVDIIVWPFSMLVFCASAVFIYRHGIDITEGDDEDGEAVFLASEAGH